MKLFILLGALAIAGWGCSNQGTTSATNEPGEKLSVSTQKGKTVSPEADLFTIIDNQQAAVGGNKYFQAIKDLPTTAGVQIARLNDNPIALLTQGSTIGLSVSANQQFVATGARITKQAANDISWSGLLQNHRGRATLVLTRHGITGTLWAESTLYKFEPIGDGLQAIVKIDQEGFKRD